MKSLDEIVPDHRSTVIFDAIDGNGREVVCVPVSLYRVTRKTVLRELRDLGIENVYYDDGACLLLSGGRQGAGRSRVACANIWLMKPPSKIPPSRPRNPTVPEMMNRKAGPHRDRKRESKNQHPDDQ